MKGQRFIPAAEWNTLLETDKGDRICDLLRPYYEAPIVLRPASPALMEELLEALQSIGMRTTSIATISMDDIETPAKRVPPGMARHVRIGSARGMRQGLETAFANDLCHYVRTCGDRRFRDVLYSGVIAAHEQALDARHPWMFQTNDRISAWYDEPIQFGLTSFLAQLVEQAAGGAPLARMAALETISRVYLAGNIPLGFAKEGNIGTPTFRKTYAVLVA